jgi:hypothetical protein
MFVVSVRTRIRRTVSAAHLGTLHLLERENGYHGTPMPERWFHPAYHAGVCFGAVTRRAALTVTEIAAALRQTVAHAAAPGVS